MGYDLVIIGAGPAGIGVAVEARFSGVPKKGILILEKDLEPCRSIRNHYPDNKIVTANYKGYRNIVHDGVMRIADMSKAATLDYFNSSIDGNDLNISYGETVSTILKDNDWFVIVTDKGEYRARICVVAIGILGKPNRPGYKIPRSLRSRIHFEKYPSDIVDSDVLMVGGSDSAAERALEFQRNKNRVTISYRRREFVRMTDTNRRMISLMEHSRQLTVLRLSDIRSVGRSDGRPRVSFADSRQEPVVFDHIIYCLGGAAPTGFLQDIGIELRDGLPVLKENYETSIPGLFLAGDLTAGKSGGSINWAFAAARRSVTYIAESYLADVAAGA
jgi:thioredoxin reductase (NADPH)